MPGFVKNNLTKFGKRNHSRQKQILTLASICEVNWAAFMLEMKFFGRTVTLGHEEYENIRDRN